MTCDIRTGDNKAGDKFLGIFRTGDNFLVIYREKHWEIPGQTGSTKYGLQSINYKKFIPL